MEDIVKKAVEIINEKGSSDGAIRIILNEEIQKMLGSLPQDSGIFLLGVPEGFDLIIIDTNRGAAMLRMNLPLAKRFAGALSAAVENFEKGTKQ